ncbi:uncharacterized protein LOC589701 isoform X2 [Strongylocentrotus purpuratus]|uniref:PDZ domain-containing protein n=1 Tax=Strongylocentrotus purpuratus TaxID=7668 RepID=A0A7M7PNE0_STRPU|nr:uncharacterized protein LOC589701 isoform X2 [Strongylocentrotus purpuratus]
MASCFCVRLGKETVKTLDFRHCNLRFVPEEIVEYDETLEELLLDSNDIRELPRDLFHCELLKKLGVSDNELVTIPTAVASLIHLEELDISKNGIVELPDNIKGCKSLRLVEVSVNPLGKLPEGFTQLMNLSHLYLNDTLLDYLPASFGRLARLKVLELRENRLKALPKSISRLTELERLDLGQNSFREIPDVIGCLTKLTEVWIDTNKVTQLPKSFGNLTCLVYFDASCNRLEYLPAEMDQLESLTDLHLSKNFLHQLPENIGQLSSLTTLKADNNQLASLPSSIGGLVSLEELILSANDLEELPPSIGLLRRLRHLNVDENMLQSVPAELGSCSGITLLSLRGNYLQVLPDEIGRIAKLTVVNLSNNRLQSLPYSFTKLKNLQALWLSENQSKPLIPLQSEFVDHIGTRVLTCFMFPQQPQDYEEDSYLSDGESFHQSVWEQERAKRSKIVFDVEESESEHHKNTARATTPYPKETIRPRFRMGVIAAPSNGHIPGKKPNLKDKVQSPQMELLPSKPSVDTRGSRRVRGRRELELDGIRIREAKVTRPRSPGSTITDSLHLFQADKSKHDRGAHSDTEAIDPEWTSKTNSQRRSLTIEDSVGQERRSSVDSSRTPLMDDHRKNDMKKDRTSSRQNGSAKHIRRSDGVVTDYGFIDRGQHGGDFVDGRGTRSGEIVQNGRRRSDVPYGSNDPRRRMGRNMNQDPRLSGTPVSGNVAFHGKRNGHPRRSGYGTDPELEELYHHSLEKDSPRMQIAQYHTPSKKSGYSTDPDRRTPQSGRAAAPGGNKQTSNKKPEPHHPHSGYGTDSEIMAYNGPFDYTSPAEDHGRSSRVAQRTLDKRIDYTPPVEDHGRSSRVAERSLEKRIDYTPPVEDHGRSSRVAERSLEKRIDYTPPVEDHGRSFRVAQRSLEKRIDCTPPVEDHGRSSRVAQRTPEKQSRIPKRQPEAYDDRKGQWVDGKGYVKELNQERVGEDNDENLHWAYPTFESNKGTGFDDEQKVEKRDYTEEPRGGNHARTKRFDNSSDLGRRAMANAVMEKGDGHPKEVGKVDLSSETESHQELHWDISEILGSSSRTPGQLSTPASSPQKSKADSVEHVFMGNDERPKRDKKIKSSTPENERQSEKICTVVSNGSVPNVALTLEDNMFGVENQMTNLELRSNIDGPRDGRPLPPYSKKRDPNLSLPPSPAQLDHRDPSASPIDVKAGSNKMSQLQYYPSKHRSDSPLPHHSNRNTPNDIAPNTRTHLRNQTPNLHIVNQNMLQSESRKPSDHLTNQIAKRGAIPTYDEAVLRRKDSLGKQQSHSLNSLTRDISKQLKVYPIPVAASNEDLLSTKQKQEAHYTTRARPSNERLNDEIDDYEIISDWHQGPRAKDHELQGQPHDRKPQSYPDTRQGQDSKLKEQSNDDALLHQNQKRSSTPSSQIPRHLSERTDMLQKQRSAGDAGYQQRSRYGQREQVNENWKQEADVSRNIPRGKSPLPRYAAQRTPTAKEELQHTYKDGRQSYSTVHDHRPKEIDHINQENTQYRKHDERKYSDRTESVPNRHSDADHHDQTDGVSGSQRDINHNRPQDSAYIGQRDTRYSGQYTPTYNQDATPDQFLSAPSYGERQSTKESLQPVEVNDDNWKHHLLNKLATKNLTPVDDEQTLVSIRRQGESTKSTVQQRRLHVLRARMQNDLKPGDESIDEVFHSPSLPSRSPGFKPQSHVPPNNNTHHHPHPHPQYQSQDKQTPDSTSGIRNRPHHHHHHHQHPTPDTHESPGQKPWQDEPVRKGPPPGYHHQRDWSPSSYEKPPQMMDHVDVAETRRGTPPGSSGSSTTGCNGRNFAPSPSLQRRLPPYHSTVAQSQSPLPVRRADPDGIGGPKTIPLVIYKNPGLGFSITGGQNSPGNPFHPEDMGIFVTKVQPDGPADHCLLPGDKILTVNNQDFVDIDHEQAVQVLKNSNPVSMVVSRET